MTMEKVRERIMEVKKELDRTKYEGGNLDKIKTAEDYLVWAEKAIEERTITEEVVPLKEATSPIPITPIPIKSGLGVRGVPRFGTPKTEEERRATHEFYTGKTELPPRGTGILSIAGEHTIEPIPLGPSLEMLRKEESRTTIPQQPQPMKIFTAVKRKY